MHKPVVSIAMITYNHEEFIEQSINGVLMQECNFEIELLISNDNSPDNTDSVIKKILKNHPKANLIKYINRTENVGMMPNFISTLTQCTGKFIALCEGDDYWTDPLKLQKQFDFLESNYDYSMICHNAKIIYEGIDKEPISFNKKKVECDININEIITQWAIPTASIFLRNEIINPLPTWFSEIYSGDFTIALLCANTGKIKFLPETMSIYRVNYSGTSASAVYKDQGIFVFKEHVKLMKYFNDYSKKKNELLLINIIFY